MLIAGTGTRHYCTAFPQGTIADSAKC